MVTSAHLLCKAFSSARPRTWLARASVLALAGMLTACGFTMRGTTPLPFDSLYLSGISDNSRFGGDVARAIRASSPHTRLMEEREQAQAVLIAVRQSRTRREVSLNPQGRVEEYELVVRYTFRLVDARGNVLLPDTTFSDTRDMPYDDNAVQAKQGETETLYRDMEKSLVSRLMRRLTAPDVADAAQAASSAPDEEGFPPAPAIFEPAEATSPDQYDWPSNPLETDLNTPQY